MREHYGPHPATSGTAFTQIGGDAIHRRGENLLVCPRRRNLQLDSGGLGLEVRNPVERNGTELVIDDDGAADIGHSRHQVQAPGRGERGTGTEPCRRIVVASCGDDDRTCAADRLEAPVAHQHGVRAGYRAVVDVPRHDHDVDTLRRNQIRDGRQRGSLIGEQIDTVEGAADVPVRSVQDPHD